MVYDLTFTSVEEILDYINSKNFTKPTSRKTYTNGFCNFSWKEAISFMKNGWSTSKKIRIEAENLEKSLEAPHGYKYETTGEILDVGTFLTGKPECWLEPDMVDNRKVYKIVVNSGYHANVNKNIIENRGIAIVSLIDLLQEDGHIVELEIVKVTNNILNKKELKIKFEIGTSPLDIDKLSFMVANPAFLRRIIFAIEEVYLNAQNCDSYGQSGDIVMDKLNEPNTIYFPCLNGYERRFETIENAKLEVERIINKTKEDN